MSALCQKRTFPTLFRSLPRRLGRMELKWSADAVRLYNHWHFGKLRKYSASAADWYPFAKKNLQGAPHRNPGDDQHGLSENVRSGIIAEGHRDFPQQHA